MTAQGICKWYNPLSGYGFIEAADGNAIFLHRSDIVGKPPQEGDVVSYEAEESSLKPGRMQARNVTGGTLGGDLEGICNTYDKYKGVGFVAYQGEYYIMHREHIKGGIPHTGDTLHFNLVPSEEDPTKQECRDVFGGSGQSIEPREKKSKATKPSGDDREWGASRNREWGAWGKGKDMKGMMMSMMCVMSTMLGPYGKGKSKGKGKGKGDSNW
eukprot:TRINITY_DN604_c4_g1_i1.p1 TRINITY_DN604_c4_g1~~TRINITY_DN604_c4_g1_i1.p1  ORF type:complete len:213 (-),score=38.06 TRINITY_DN604_c4_g1_i1:382-1020(-)